MRTLKSLLKIALLAVCLQISAQQKAKTFEPAKAQKKHYSALYVLNQGDDKKIKGFLRNVSNVLNDTRLAGRLNIEVVAFADGVEMYKKTNAYQQLLTELTEKGVVFTQCLNTIVEKKIEKSELFDFVQYVPSGNGEIILRQYEGWAVVHP